MSEEMNMEECVDKVFKLLADMSVQPGETLEVFQKAELLEAQDGDFRVFEKMDSDSDGSVTLEEWRSFITKTMKEKGEKKGPRWRKNLLHTLESNMEKVRLKEKTKWVEMDKVFDLLESMSMQKDEVEPVFQKEELVEAHEGDFKIFEKMDSDSDGNITKQEWRDFISKTEEEKGEKKGERWRNNLLNTLTTNIGQIRLEAAKRGQDCDRIFRLLATMSVEPGETLEHFSKDELLEAHDGDFHIFEKMDSDSDGKVTLQEWRNFIMTQIDARGENKGERWRTSLFHTLEMNLTTEVTAKMENEDSVPSAIVSNGEEVHDITALRVQVSDKAFERLNDAIKKIQKCKGYLNEEKLNKLKELKARATNLRSLNGTAKAEDMVIDIDPEESNTVANNCE